MANSGWQDLKDEYPPIPEDGDETSDITELDRDPLAQSFFTPLLVSNVELDEMHPPTEGNADEMIPDEYLEVLSTPTVFAVEDQKVSTQPDPWFDQDHDNIASGNFARKGCLNISQEVEEQIGHHKWFTADDVDDMNKIPYTLGTIKQYLEALSESPIFEKESGKPNKYKMTRTWAKTPSN